MFPFRATAAIVVWVVIAIACLLAQFGAAWLQLAQTLLGSAGFYQLLALVATGFLGGAAAGLRSRLPNHGGRPPRASLLQHLKTPAAGCLAALLLGAGIAGLLAASPELTRLRVVALNTALGFNIGILCKCLWAGFSMVRQYRADCAWEDLVHPRSA